MSVHAGQRAGRAIRDVPRTKNTAGTSRSMESSKPSGAQQPQLPAAGAQRRRQHLSWPRSMRRCHARQWLAAELQPAHEPRRRQSAAVRASAVKRGRLRGVAAATAGALSTNSHILYFLMLSCLEELWRAETSRVGPSNTGTSRKDVGDAILAWADIRAWIGPIRSRKVQHSEGAR